tara:strand:+ start:118 stop:318 length:201 start_codon:yes stop_codon:yes gene_type:complete
MYKKGDLVSLMLPNENNIDERLIGIILEITTWPEYNDGDGITDLYVHWSNGDFFWCCDSAVSLLKD